ncbi:MAG TPA: cation-transporting P-type ATPase [Acidimicrobiales bacterium]|nr:cation-transporting P-type ATPase [Acidimicrobiales bacterium]
MTSETVNIARVAGGLSSAEAGARLAREGPNVLPAGRVTAPWRQLLAQMTHFFAALLWVAAGLAALAGMVQLGAAIVAVVLVNGVFAFAQEYRAGRAAVRLRSMLPRRAWVRRDGASVEIDAAELVTGDVVLLEAGDRISADLEVISARLFAVDCSMLTGESVPERPEARASLAAGTFAVEGEAEALVVATGARTRLAGIVELTQHAKRPTSPLTLELNRVVRMIATIAVGVGIAFFAIAWLVGFGAKDGFLFAVGVTVALVPEGLLPTVTLSLARGAQRMAGRKALVRHLESVETLGSTTFICTDKTGTLTRNEMSVVEAWTLEGEASVSGTGYEPTGAVSCASGTRPSLVRLGLAGARCSDGRAMQQDDGSWVALGDPMEAALHVFARRLGVDVDADERARPQRDRVPFDPRRRRMSVVVGGRLVVKGAPEAVLGLCLAARGASIAADRMAERGLRVLAIAARRWDEPGTPGPEDERDLDLLGLVAMEDPPRPHTAAAVASCRDAGIRIAVVTGDHPATAMGIAREVGIAGPDSLAVEGKDLPADEEVLGALLDRDGVVISRVDPEDKLRIARALQRRGHVVAMTGDGVNDGPALQEADIGVAMGRSGTDVAREAADLVLLDDDFATIVAAIGEGRSTFNNIRRFLTYHLTDNVAELTPFVLWALSGGRFPLALGVLQILCLDIGTDLLPALALGAEPPRPDSLHRPPTTRHLIDRRLILRVFGVLGAAEAAVEILAFSIALLLAGWRPGGTEPSGAVLAAASGAAFTAVVFGQMGNAFACRSVRRAPWSLGWLSNRLVLGAVVVELAALVGFLFFHPVAHALGQAPPAFWPAVAAVATAPVVLLADALHKWWIWRPKENTGAG